MVSYTFIGRGEKQCKELKGYVFSITSQILQLHLAMLAGADGGVVLQHLVGDILIPVVRDGLRNIGSCLYTNQATGPIQLSTVNTDWQKFFRPTGSAGFGHGPHKLKFRASGASKHNFSSFA